VIDRTEHEARVAEKKQRETIDDDTEDLPSEDQLRDEAEIADER
jgi:hypothetical protein